MAENQRISRNKFKIVKSVKLPISVLLGQLEKLDVKQIFGKNGWGTENNCL